MLANLYLSGGKKEILVGNFIAGVKGIRDLSGYPSGVKKGIELYQSVMEFAETDPIFIHSKGRLNPKFSKYSSFIIQFFYDHFLAANWNQYSSLSLEKFTMNAYRVLLEYQKILPYKAKHFLPRMIRGNWLQKFSSLAGVHQVINQMDIKSTRLTHIISAFEDLISEYTEFYSDFSSFFPRVISYANDLLQGNQQETRDLVTLGQ